MIHNCLKCSKEREHDEILCDTCFRDYVRVCTCNKLFIVEKPTKYLMGKIDDKITLRELPDPIPEYYYTCLSGNFYTINACRGCSYDSEVSIKDNLTEATSISITACVYQKFINDSGETEYEYISDMLDPVFEKYALEHGIELGIPAEIKS